jgi:hypothetical protein
MSFRIIFISLFFAFTVSCTDDRAPSGISSMIYYAEGDCMPPVNENSRNYKPYSGKVWIIEKSMADTLSVFLNDSSNSKIHFTTATEGNFSLLVAPGSYYIMPDTMFYISEENLVTIHPDDLIIKDFKFFKCTSF